MSDVTQEQIDAALKLMEQRGGFQVTSEFGEDLQTTKFRITLFLVDDQTSSRLLTLSQLQTHFMQETTNAFIPLAQVLATSIPEFLARERVVIMDLNYSRATQ